MANEIISYFEMCQREGSSLQRGMNYRLSHNYSVILMSMRPNAPYSDQVLEDGIKLIYEGHDVSKTIHYPNPKLIDQPEVTETGHLTENGKFYKAAQEYKRGLRSPEVVKVYEKIRSGIWSYNGMFHLIDSWTENDGSRLVYKFELDAIIEQDLTNSNAPTLGIEHRRIIPTHVKLEVWKRNAGKCAICGVEKDLHFDHIIPYSKGGTSLSADNIQLLCARHNLEKRDRIE